MTRAPRGERWAPSRAVRRSLLTAATAAAISLTACGGAPSTLEPRGPGALRIADLWWFMFAVSAVVVVLICALVVFAIAPRRRRARSADDPDTTPRWAAPLVTAGGD